MISEGTEPGRAASSRPAELHGRSPDQTPSDDRSGRPGGGTLVSRHWRLLAGMTITAIAVSLVATLFTSNSKWEASALVRVGPPVLPRTFTDPAYVDRILQTAQQIASQDAVIEAVWEEAGVAPSPGQPDPNTVSVEVERDTELLRFGVTDEGPAPAQVTLQAMLGQARSEINRVYGDRVVFTAIGAEGEVRELHPAYLLRGLTAGVAGLLLGLGIASLIDRSRGATETRP